jgi:hypothetical protein
MKKDLSILLHEVEKTVGKSITLASDFEKLAAVFLKKHIMISPAVLKKVWGNIDFLDKLSPETLDKLALFAGFQSWNDFQKALHGQNDADLNYEDKPIGGHKTHR